LEASVSTQRTPLHYVGFLSNVDDSVTRLNWAEDFSIGKASADEVEPFLKKIRNWYGELGEGKVLSDEADALSPWCYCIKKEGVDEYEFPSAAWVFPEEKWQEIRQRIDGRIRSLRLLKEGNAIVRIAFLYHGEHSNPQFLSGSRKQYIPDRAKLTLDDGEIPNAQSFLTEVEIPFHAAFLQTAYEAFDQSYEVEAQSMAFLSLMIAMEALLGPKSVTEITHQVPRNAAVLLGADACESERIFRDMKKLYSMRSKVVHGEAPTKPKDQLQREDLLRLRHYVRTSIRLLGPATKSRDEVLARLNECAFGAHPFAPSNSPQQT
jgi:hypothetical protein